MIDSDETIKEVLETRDELLAEFEMPTERDPEKDGAKKIDPPQEGGPPEDFSFDHLKKTYYLNEYGDADITIRVFKNRFVRDNATGDFYRFVRHRWFKCKNREQEAEFREVADIYSKEAARCAEQALEADKREKDAKQRGNQAGEKEAKDEKAKQYRWRDNFNIRAKALRGNARMRNVLNLATAGTGSLGTDGEGWNIDPRLFPVANGVVDLETGKLRDGRFDDWFSFGSPVEYLGYHHQGDFIPAFLNQLLCGKEELIDYIEYLLGFACTGIQTKDFFVVYGPMGNNGKSILFDWVSRVMGEFAATMPVEMVYEDRFGRDPDKPSPQLLALRGLRLAIMSEPDRNKRLSVAKVKYLTSGTDKIGGRNLNEKNLVAFWPTHTTVMHGNEIPRVLGSQKAFYDRWKIFPFRARFVRDEDEIDEENHVYKQIPRQQLDQELRQHDQEMLSFLIRCARKALMLGDMPPAPAAVLKENQDFMEEEDLVGRYLRQCTIEKPYAREQAKDVYRSFCYFCREELGLGIKQTPSQKAISADLRAQPHISRDGSARHTFYQGIEILPEWMTDEQ